MFGQSSQPTFGRLPLVEISKGAPDPVKLPKDWREKAGQTTSTTCGKPTPVKLPQNWKEEMSQNRGFVNTSTTTSSATKLDKNWKERTLEGKHLGSVGSDAKKLPKNWKEKVDTDGFVAPTKLPKDWNKDASKSKSAPVKLGKDWQASAEKEKAGNGVKLSKDWNKNLELSKHAFAVKLPKGWMEQALAEQRQRRLQRQSTGAAASPRRERRRDTDCTLLLPSAWEKLPPQELISNLCSSAQAEKLSSEAKEKLESELTDRLLGKDRDEQAVRLEKGWAKHLPPQPKGSHNSRLPARLVLPTDWKEKEAETLAAELGVTLPPEQEETEVLPRNWALDLPAGEGEKIGRHGKGSVKKKKYDMTEKRKSIQVEKKSEERQPRGRPKKAKGEKKSEDRLSRGRPKKAKVEQESKPDLCEYELIRLENIRQREELFAELHLGDAKADVALPKSAKSKAVKVSKSEKAKVSKSEKAKGSKSEKVKGSKSEKEVRAEVMKQLERPALEGWKREVVISKGCPRLDDDFNLVEGLDQVTVAYWPPWQGGEALVVPKITPDMRLAGVKRFKTKATLEKFLESTNSTLTSKNFSFNRRVLGLAGGFEVVRKNQNEESAAADGNDAANAGGNGGAAGAEVIKRVKRKNMTAAAAGRKRKQSSSPLAPECREVAEEELAMVKGIGGREEKQTHKSQEVKGGGDLLDTSEEMVDEEYESGGEGHGINGYLEERNKKVLEEKVLEEKQRGEGETGNTLEESEEDFNL